jgi:TM2 domain-containing membrane protein YozV
MVDITEKDMIAIEIRTDEETKAPFQAYVLWFFLGWLGAHRFYAGRGKSGLAMVLLTCSVIGFPISFLWWLADSVLLGGILQEDRELVRDRIARETLELRELD